MPTFTTQIAIRISPEDYERLRQRAVELGVSVTAYVANIVANHLRSLEPCQQREKAK